jgi:hypothetical protein
VITIGTWIREREPWVRLADVKVPNGLLLPALLAARVRQRRSDRAVDKFAGAASDLGTTLGTRVREGDERNARLLALQVSVEQLTRRLVILTIVLGLIGLGGIGATLWAALR